MEDHLAMDVAGTVPVTHTQIFSLSLSLPFSLAGVARQHRVRREARRRQVHRRREPTGAYAQRAACQQQAGLQVI